MVSTRQSSRAEQVASNAWGGADGGFIFADVPNAVTSAVVIIHQISMHRNITPLRVTRLSRVSSRASGGFTTIVQRNSSPARSFPLLTHIRWINRCPDQPNGCLQTGKRCFTNRVGSFGCGQFRLQNYSEGSSSGTYLGAYLRVLTAYMPRNTDALCACWLCSQDVAYRTLEYRRQHTMLPFTIFVMLNVLADSAPTRAAVTQAVDSLKGVLGSPSPEQGDYCERAYCERAWC
jgi:hypothetical protein